MVEKITELTEEQKALFPVIRDKWIEIGLSTERVDFERAKMALVTAYRCGNVKHPPKIEFARGPQEAFEMAKIQAASEGIKDFTVGAFLEGCIFGSQEAGWLSFYDYFVEACDFEFPQLEGLNDLAYTSGWCAIFDTWACIMDRPLFIKFDEDNRLHSETGPAIEYADGFKVYAWHGTAVPDEWIADKGHLTAQMALNWENMEQRRAACEILGWDNILKTLKAKVIDEDEDKMIGTLLRVNLPGLGKEQFLRVLCGTGREFAIPVPPTVKTALEANAWSYNMPLDAFGRGPEVRT
jgi:hypothetical protein